MQMLKQPGRGITRLQRGPQPRLRLLEVLETQECPLQHCWCRAERQALGHSKRIQAPSRRL